MPDAALPDTLLGRFFLDAQDAFLQTVDHIPAPGRGGPIGKLNRASFVIGHTTTQQDEWLHRFVAQRGLGEWTKDWFARGREENCDAEPATFEEAREAFVRIAERSAETVAAMSRDDAMGETDLSGTPFEGNGTRNAYMVLRSLAHLYVHAGELTVIASLMGADDVGLPGLLLRSVQPTAEDDWTVPLVAALLLDGYVEVDRVADVTPTPAAEGAMDRLNPVSHTLAHLVGREDRLWNVAVGGREKHPRMVEVGSLSEPNPVPWGIATSALHEVTESVTPWLLNLDGVEGAKPMEAWGAPSSVAAQVARSAGHFFSHAGDIMAHASLYGARDLGMPGKLAHVREATTR